MIYDAICVLPTSQYIDGWSVLFKLIIVSAVAVVIADVSTVAFILLLVHLPSFLIKDLRTLFFGQFHFGELFKIAVFFIFIIKYFSFLVNYFWN